MINKENLDKRICDCEEEAQNTETYREFIKDSEDTFGMECSDIDKMGEAELENYFYFLCELWNK